MKSGMTFNSIGSGKRRNRGFCTSPQQADDGDKPVTLSNTRRVGCIWKSGTKKAQTAERRYNGEARLGQMRVLESLGSYEHSKLGKTVGY